MQNIKKFLFCTLSLCLALSQSVSALAANDVTITYNQTADEVYAPGAQTSELTISATMPEEALLGNGAVVILPAKMDPILNSAGTQYEVADVIGVRGRIKSNAVVAIMTDKNINYKLQNSSTEVPATVTFGSEYNDKLLCQWDAEEVLQGRESQADSVFKPISVSIEESVVEGFGKFDSSIELDISYVADGLYTSIVEPENCTVTYNANSARYLSNPNNEENWNLNCSSMGSYGIFKINKNPNGDTYVKTIEWRNDSDCVPLNNVDVTDRVSIDTPFVGFTNMTTLILPNCFTAEDLHAYKADTSSPKRTCHDYTNTCFTNTDILIGNALVFVKDVFDGNYIYIPNIVFRGTVEEWKALSGSSDWVFGNKLNEVQVHCYDGVLTY